MTATVYADAHLHPDDSLIGVHPGSFVNAAAESEWDECMAFAEKRGCRAFLGVHPWFLDGASPGWVDRLRALVQDHPIGIGEIGLDRTRGPSLNEQLAAFETQLDIAMALERPVSIHCVKRWGALIDALEDRLPFTGTVMIHGFNGSVDVQDRLLEMGCFLSFGLALLDGSAQVVDLWRLMPENRSLLESDAPPSFITRDIGSLDYGATMGRLLESAASVRECSSDSLAASLGRNVAAFVGK